MKSSEAVVATVQDEKEQTVPEEKSKEEVITSRVYDATAIGEPMAIGKDKQRVWEKLLTARVIYLGESEQVPVRDDRDLELEIVRKVRNKCIEQGRPVSLALEIFPCTLQEQLNQFMDGRIDGEGLKSFTLHWPPHRWQEYEPILNYCRDNRVRLVACGTPPEVIRTVQAEGIHGLSKAERKTYTPPAGSGFIAGFTSIARRSSVDMMSPNSAVPFGPSSYLSAQARVVEDYTMSQIILQAILEGGSSGMLIVVTGASHVMYGSRGIGVPARVSKKLQKKNQSVILLNPERQDIRREGEVPVADFLWYSAARPCSRNCFDRAEIARVMNAAGRKRDALPQDLQKGLDLGLVSPEVLQNFFDLEQYPLIAELTHRFQGFRERLLADPKFLHRLAIEEAISITTTLLAQYERRKENFFDELDYVITDTMRGTVVDFFTVWLPAPTLSFLSYADETSIPDNLEVLKGILGSIPDNAFQENMAGKDWNLSHRFASVLLGGVKLSGVGFVSSISAVAASNALYSIRQLLNPEVANKMRNKRSPIFKTAVVYSSFLGTSANLRYQIIAGLVEHRISDHVLSSQPLVANLLSFVVRTLNSFWGTQQWVDLARFSGLQQQTQKTSLPVSQPPDTFKSSTLDCNTFEMASSDEITNQSGDNPNP
ncbi:protein RETICULATA-RELATED 6, chloroplastic-like [Aristolochia californica]|uniref:protein RETICULATA-RELATED 6, chloroplastic-like n=1 Tax=Aristolochia californica TaxID=171875 RepID=UPI0035D89076